MSIRDKIEKGLADYADANGKNPYLIFISRAHREQLIEELKGNPRKDEPPYPYNDPLSKIGVWVSINSEYRDPLLASRDYAYGFKGPRLRVRLTETD